MLASPTGRADAEPRPSRGAPDRARWRSALLLVALAITVSVPGLRAIAPIDRDEARFAQASRQMFESVLLPPAERDPRLHQGGLVVPMLADRPRLNKPPLTYWLQAGSAAIFTLGDASRDSIWMYRIPGVLCLIAAVLVTWRLGSRMLDERAGFIAGAILAASPLLAVDAHQARSDLPLLAFTTATLAGLHGAWISPRRLGLLPAICFWACLGGAILAKGPIAPLVVALTVAVLCIARRDRRLLGCLRPGIGFVLLAALIAPWVVSVGERIGWDAYLRTIADETFGRVQRSREGHWGPPGYHFVAMIGLLWPGSLLIGRGAWRAWVRRDEPAPAFLLAWIAPAWIFFEAIPSKLPHYTMPLYPALAILAAWCLTRDPPPRPPRPAIIGWALAAIVPALALIGFIATRSAIRFEGAIAALLLAGSASMTIAAGSAAWRGSFIRAQHLAIAACVLLLVPALQHVAPKTLPGFGTPRLARSIQAALAREPAGVASTYHEDSFVFAMRGRLTRVDEPDVAGWIAEHPRGIIVVPARHDLGGLRHEIVGVLGTNPLRPDEPDFIAVRAGGSP